MIVRESYSPALEQGTLPPRRRSDYGEQPQTTQFSKSVPSTMSVWGPKHGFINGRRARGEWVACLGRGATLKGPIRNRRGDSAAKRRKGSSVISCSVKLKPHTTQPNLRRWVYSRNSPSVRIFLSLASSGFARLSKRPLDGAL